jgi:nucleotide-binding universal stress UspA family protein
MKLLIGYDGSPCADAALDDLRFAGLPNDVQAIVLSAADVWLRPTGEIVRLPSAEWVWPRMEEAQAVSAQLVEQAQALAQGARTRLQTIFPDWKVYAEACAGSPAWAITLRAEEWQADLIVVGSHGRSPLGRLILGSVSQTVVTQAHTSVRVARARSAESHHPLCILVGVDGSAQAELAVRAVSRRAWPSGTTIRLVTAVDPMLVTILAATFMPVGWEADESEDERARVRKMLEGAADTVRLRNPGLEVATVMEDGDPKHVLVREAERCGADCIFVGARGRNQLQRLWLGSVSAAVTARAHCSVEVVRSLSVSQ